MIISSFLPGATYSASAFTIPWTAINTALTNDVTAVDSIERLLFALLQVLQERQAAGTVTQVTLGCEISNTSVSLSTWETASSQFQDRTVVSHLVTFDAGSSQAPLLIDADTVTSV